MEEQIKLYSVPDKAGFTHDQDPEEHTDNKKSWKKISEEEKRKRGFISPKAEDQVKKIVDGIHNK